MNKGKRKREEVKGKQQDWKNAKRKKMSETENGSLFFDLKEAKKEVRKFGIAGMVGEDKKSATIKMLIGLGAKPPKSKYINYKQLQENQKKEKMLNSEENQRKPKKKKKRSKDVNDVKGSIDGQIGTFKDGYLKLNKAELKMVTKKGNSSGQKGKGLSFLG